MHDRLKQLVNRGRVEDAEADKDRPTLRRKTTGKIPDAGTTEDSKTTGSTGDTSSTSDSTEDPDGRPTLKRR